MSRTSTDASLLRLLQLSSVSLPVGGYSFSQGLEYAVEAGWVSDHQSAGEWLLLQLQHSLMRVDLAVVFRLYPAVEQCDLEQLAYWNRFILACRETQELHLTDLAMGEALERLLPSLQVPLPALPDEAFSFVTLFCTAAAYWQLDPRTAALGLAWSWLENQVAAATKLIPLGQTHAQQLLSELQGHIPEAVNGAVLLDDTALGSGLPAVALASSLHETQYSRLFRS